MMLDAVMIICLAGTKGGVRTQHHGDNFALHLAGQGADVLLVDATIRKRADFTQREAGSSGSDQIYLHEMTGPGRANRVLELAQNMIM